MEIWPPHGQRGPLGHDVAEVTADSLHTEHAQHRLGQLLDDLRVDLPHRLHRHTGLPVTTITATRGV